MKILCPTDFSENSMNAIFWVLEYLEHYDHSELEIVHCINMHKRADMFSSIDEMMLESANKGIDILKTQLANKPWKTKIEYNVYKVDPKSFIPEYAKKIKANIIAAGSKGLTSIKDITIGSVTEEIAQRTSIPLLIIPVNSKFENIEKVVIGVDEKLIAEPQPLHALDSFLPKASTELLFAKVVKEETSASDQQASIQGFEKYNSQLVNLALDETIAKSLNTFSDTSNADILVLAHKQRSWFGRLFHNSVMKKGLFSLRIPIFVIPI